MRLSCNLPVMLNKNGAGTNDEQACAIEIVNNGVICKI